jgi:hypothetical protein
VPLHKQTVSCKESSGEKKSISQAALAVKS